VGEVTGETTYDQLRETNGVSKVLETKYSQLSQVDPLWETTFYKIACRLRE
jgi:hypothetical protein